MLVHEIKKCFVTFDCLEVGMLITLLKHVFVKSNNISTFSAPCLVLLSVTMFPSCAFQRAQWYAKHFQAKVASKGHGACFSFQYSSGPLCRGALMEQVAEVRWS